MSAEKRPTLFGFPIVEVEGMETPAILFAPSTERRAVAVRQRFKHDPQCEHCHGTGIGITATPDVAAIRIEATTPCVCGQPDGFDMLDVSNTVILSP